MSIDLNKLYSNKRTGVNNPTNSGDPRTEFQRDFDRIIFPATNRENLDWETINKLAMNSDFKEFIATVKIDITSKKIHKKEYDPISDPEKLKMKND